MDNHTDEFNTTTLEQDSHDQHSDKPWGDVIGASLIVQLITFSGLLLVAFSAVCRHKGRAVEHLRLFLVPAFAAGALGATTVFLLIPEALKLLQSGTTPAEEEHALEFENGTSDTHADEETHDEHEGHNHLMFFRRILEEAVVEGEEHHEDEHDENTSYMWMFGVAVLAGFILPVFISALFPSDVILEECPVCVKSQDGALQDIAEEDGDVLLTSDEDNDSVPKSTVSKHETLDLNCEEGVCDHCPGEHEQHSHKKVVSEPITHPSAVNASSPLRQHGVRNWSLVASISLGDALHNFTDGIFLGNAFLLCGRSVAYTMVATTIYHELAQEISDLGLLTNHCGLPLWMALALNFLAGSSTMIGALLVLSFDVTEKAMGIFLAISAGVYINIFACECMPRVQAQLKSPSRTLQFLLCFALGAVPIGLVLLDHEHCEADGHAH